MGQLSIAKDKHGKEVAILRTLFNEREICAFIPSAKWNRKNNYWEFHITAVPDIVDSYKRAKKGLTISDGALDADKHIRRMLKQIREIKAIPSGDARLKHEVLMEHQMRCNLIAKVVDKYGLFLDTGTGKTLTSLSIIKDNLDMRWLALTPKSVIKTGWIDDQLQFFPELHMLPISRNIKTEFYQMLAKRWGIKMGNRISRGDAIKQLADYAQIFLTNPESFKSDLKWISTLGISGVVFDESAKLKNPTSDTTKEFTAFCEGMKKVYLLSGKPAPNDKMEYYPQMKIINPNIFGSNFFKFRMKFFNSSGYGGFEWHEKQEAAKEFTERMQDYCIFINKDDCLDLPEKTYIVRNVELSPKVMKYYKEMAKSQMLMLEDKTVSAPSKLASLMKLRQITSGFIIDTDDHSTATPLHSEKLSELSDVLEEIGDKQVIIWAQFQFEIKQIEEFLQKKGKTVVTAYGGTKDTDSSVEAFKTNQAQYIIAHPATLMYGVTFVNCTYAVYYSMSHSYEGYYQSHDRIYRKGQTKPCTFIFILAEGTIDMAIYKVIQQKGDSALMIEEFIKGVREHD